jgi:exonuclease VII large subunit
MKEELKRNIEKLVTVGQAKRVKEKENLFFWKNRLEDLSPLSVLKRGYSICFSHPEGEIITKYKQVKEKEKIRVKLYKGEIYSGIYRIKTD